MQGVPGARALKKRSRLQAEDTVVFQVERRPTCPIRSEEVRVTEMKEPHQELQ